MATRRQLKLVTPDNQSSLGTQRKRKIERRPLKVPQHLIELVRQAAGDRQPYKNPFVLPQFPPDIAKQAKSDGLALDDANSGLSDNFNWASVAWQGGMVAMYQEGLVFPGYVYLAELAQRPEYRVVSETISTEMTRKWIKIKTSADDDDGKEANERIKQLEKEFDRLHVRHWFQKAAEIDGYMGRSHLYIDVGDPNEPDKNKTAFNRDELLTPIGTGKDEISKSKIGKGWLRRLKTVEPIWVYPTNYDASNPLSTDWYEPDVWYVMGTRIHKSRLLRFVGREVPDILKPAYAFGGLSMSQMLKPYVDNWLRTRQSVADIVNAFSTFVLSTDLGALLTEGGDEVLKRIELFNLLRNNKGTMAIDKEREAFQNVSAPLGGLDSLQAQTQEHMASIARIPLVKLLGIQPAGLNASSEGEIRTFYDFIHAYQEHLFRARLDVIFHMAQLNLWGEVDPELTYEFEPLWELDEAALAGVQKTKSDMHASNIQAGIIDAEEARRSLANDPDSPYQGIDVTDVPEPPQQEEGGEGEGPDMTGFEENGQPGDDHEHGDAQDVEEGGPRRLPDSLGPIANRLASENGGRGMGQGNAPGGGRFRDGRAGGGLGRGNRSLGTGTIGGRRVAIVELDDDAEDHRDDELFDPDPANPDVGLNEEAGYEGVEPEEGDTDDDSVLPKPAPDIPAYGSFREDDDEPGSKPQLGYPMKNGAKKALYKRLITGSGSTRHQTDAEGEEASDSSLTEAMCRWLASGQGGPLREDAQAALCEHLGLVERHVDTSYPIEGGISYTLTPAGIKALEKHMANKGNRGGFIGDAAAYFSPEARLSRFLGACDRRLSQQWNEQEHPRGPDGKFVQYAIGAGLAKQATKLGFTHAQQSPSGKVRLKHKSGAVLIVEPAGKGVASNKYTLYRPGQEPIHDVTGQTGKSFAAKIAPFLDTSGETNPPQPPPIKPPPPKAPPPVAPPKPPAQQPPPKVPPPPPLPPVPPKPKEPKAKKQKPLTRDQKIDRALKAIKVAPALQNDNRVKMMTQAMAEVAADFDMRNPDKMQLVDYSYEFELNGRKMKAAGTHHSVTGDVKIYANDVGGPGAIKNVMAHELMHDKWAFVKAQYRKEQNDAIANGDTTGRAMLGGGAQLKPGVDAKKYPTLTKMNKAFFGVPEHVWAATDGITPYSTEYWIAFKNGKCSLDIAINETLAEMSAIQYTREGHVRTEEGSYIWGKLHPRNEPPRPHGHQLGNYHGNKPPLDPKRIEQSGSAWTKLFNMVDKLYAS